MTADPNQDDAVSPDKGRKTPIVTVVLTPGRSGSSLLMEVLGNLGAGLSDEMIPGRLENPHGFFEDARVVEIHKKLMSDLEARPGFPMPEGWLDQRVTRKAKRALTDLVRKQVSAGPAGWAIKDPRISELLPLWLQVFNSAGVTPRFILALRDPAAVAISLRRGINRDERLTELQWLYRTSQALYHSAGDCFVLHYEDWFERPGELARGLALYCGLGDIPEERAYEAVQGALEERLDRSSWQDYETRHPLVRELYGALRDCRGTDFDRRALLEKVRETTELLEGFRKWAELVRPARPSREAAGQKERANTPAAKEDGAVHAAAKPPEPAPPAAKEGDTASSTENERVLRKMVRENHHLLRALRESEQRNEDLRTRLAAQKTQTPQPMPKAEAKGGQPAKPRPAPASRRKGGDPRHSVRYRLGDVLVKAVSRPGRDTLAAPVRLWRLLREGLHNRHARRTRRRAAG